jgi:RNA polymerase sigma factor (sigma-70 family)
MIGVCYRYTGNRQLAEDLAHDAFLKAIDKAGSFKGDGVFEGWLRKVVVNHVLTYIRDQKRNQSVYELIRYESEVVDENSVTPDLPEGAEFSVQELLDVINDLPEHHRLVFNLYVIDDFKHAQIAELLGITEGTSKSHLARARKKIRQLLAQKAKQKQRRGAIAIFLFHNRWSIDGLYNKRLKAFEVTSRKALTDFSNASSVSISPPYAGASWINIAAASFIGGLIVTSAIFFVAQTNEMPQSEVALTQTVSEDSIDKKTNETEYSAVAGHKENNSHQADSGTATLPHISVIQSKTIKTNSMKTLDSLTMALLVSSGVAFDSAAQVKIKADTLGSHATHEVVLANHAADETKVVQFLSPADARKSGKQEGTFYATSLYWSADNHELYFKGKVKVDVGENNFVSSGSVTFLGKVYLLIIDDSPVKLDSTIELSQHEYRLKQLNDREATKKYGERGENGAVEINVIE